MNSIESGLSISVLHVRPLSVARHLIFRQILRSKIANEVNAKYLRGGMNLNI